MARIFITGSTDGIGRRTAEELLGRGHEVVLHARSRERAADVADLVDAAASVVVGDLASLREIHGIAEQLAGEHLDAVIHNAGIGGGQSSRETTEDGIERIFAVNTVAPYLLTALLPLAPRMVYLTSGLEAQGVADLDDPQFASKPWDGMQCYSDSKLWDVALALAVARRHPGVVSNAVDPGWIRTKLGGPQATDDLAAGAETQVWLCDSEDPAALRSGRYLKWREELSPNPAATREDVQEAMLSYLAELTGRALA